YPDARLLLVGAAAERFDLDRRLERLGLGGSDAVRREHYVAEERMWSLMAACDVCVNLRSPTMGETSGSAIRVLSLGKPLIVSDVGWFGELPDDVALKIPVDEFETRTLEAALELLAASPAPLAADGGAVDHGRRAALLGARQELRRARPLRRARGREPRARVRLPDGDRAGVSLLRRRPGCVRGREGDQLDRDVARRRPGLPA